MGKAKRTFRVGKGADGQEYGVSRIINKGGKAFRRKPCKTCPWRKDAKTGAFPPDAYRSSASTCYDAALTSFSCHESGAKEPAICAGFVLANSENNMALRIAAMQGRFDRNQVDNPENVALYESYRDMAVANGVDPEDARIAPCRGDDENWQQVRDRMRQHNIQPAIEAKDFIRQATDEDHNKLMKSSGRKSTK